MSVNIGLISDVHATVDPLREALSIFEKEGVDQILCAGDIAGYGTDLLPCVELLIKSGCTTIMGNHESWYLDRESEGQEEYISTFFHALALTWDASVEGKRICTVHASPPDSMRRGIVLLDQYGKMITDAKEMWTRELAGSGLDVLIVGHTHQVFSEMLGQTLVINPGSTKFNHTCAILSLPSLEVKVIPLSGKEPRKVWHWANQDFG